MSQSPPQAVPPRLLLHPVHCLSLGFGAGLVPRWPGTAGTLVGVVLYVSVHGLLSTAGYLLATAVLFVLGVGLCGHTARRLGVHDHRAIVWDEVVGYWITMSFAPPGWWWIIVGFVLFRVLDIWKPWPIRWVDRHVGGGLGIMSDDVLAGMVAAGLMQAISLVR